MEIDPEVLQQWEKFEKKRQPGLIETLSIGFSYIGSGLVKASMPVSAKNRQPFGFLHGGASVALAETTASLGSWLLIDPEKERAVALEINANHLRSVTDGHITAEANIVHQGRRIHVWEISIHNEKNQLICTSRCTITVFS